MSNYSVLKQDINNNIYENQTQQITGTVLNAILNEMTASLGAGYQFAGVATVGMNPGDPDQRVFYLAGEGIYTNFGGIQVPAGKLGVLKWDNRWTLQTIDGLGGGGANLTGYVSVASTDDLPDEGQPTLGYLCGTNLYLYVGEGGDTKEGKYQDCGSFRGPEGAYIQDIEQTETSHENGGRNTIKMTLSDGRSFNAYVHNGTTSSGLFPTVEALQAAYPNPVVGQYAFVGAGFPADIYVCTTAGTWTDSGEDYDGDNVDLTDYATKAEVNQLEAKVDESVECAFGYESEDPITPTSSQLSISDEGGNVLAELGGYGLKTKYYDSEKNARIFDSSSDNDLAIVDEYGYAIMVFKNGVARTKNTEERDGIQWRGKKWYAYGTSITNINNEGKYPNYLRDISGMLLTNKGISGGGIGNNLGAYSRGQVKTALMNITDGKLEADLITLETGANDVGPDTPLGTIYDTGDDTLAGCLNQCLRYLQANTTAQIVVFPSPSYNSAEFDAHYHEWQLLIRDICFINKVYFIDGENGMGWAKLHSSQRALYIVDTIHQTDLGGSLFAQSIWGQLKNIPLFATSLT